MRHKKNTAIVMILAGIWFAAAAPFADASPASRVQRGPFGSFDSPADGATVTGNIPVTGWALAASGISRVILYRDPCENEKQEYVFISHPAFVEGARDDVAEAYPGFPDHDRAGWGYMLLTNTLPNGGNGRYTLHAAAVDNLGNWKKLGEKVIYADNAHSRLPFGTIDTPEQGGTAEGDSYINYGWALTPQPNMIPPGGQSFLLWIDGVLQKQNAQYNIYREDISVIFPHYRNSNGAAAFFTFNADRLEDGLHTIAWTVWDDAGNIAGIGSRYFRTQKNAARAPGNGKKTTNGVSPAIQLFMEKIRREPAALEQRKHIASIPPVPVYFREQWKQSSRGNREFKMEPPRDPDPVTGVIRLKANPLEPLALRLLEKDETLLGGFRRIGDRMAPLPGGAFLDRPNGVFYWHPGPAFHRGNRLIFFKTNASGHIRKQEIQIVFSR